MPLALSRSILCGALALALVLPATAQAVLMDTQCVLRADDPGEPVPQASLRIVETHTVVTRRSSTFEVTYTGFTAEAEAAFQRAVDIWSDHIVSDVPIRVTAQFAPLASGVLGSAGPLSAYANRPQFPLPSTLYPDALADALVGSSLSGSADIRATFNSTFAGFDFGLEGNPPANLYDFATVVLHELGHGLGFVGSARLDNGNGAPECDGVPGMGCWGLGALPLVYDRFVEDGAGVAFLDETVYPNPSSELFNLLISDDLFFDGVTLSTTQGNAPVQIEAPQPFRAGSSYSHFDEGTFENTSDALMTPFIDRGEAYSDVGVTTCALFADLGWELGDGCQFLVADEPIAATGDAIRLVSANPARGAAQLSLTLTTPGPVRAELLDVLGRRVVTLYQADASAGELRLQTPADLAPGAYIVRVATPDGPQTARVVRL